MRQELKRVENITDENGNPTGGLVSAVGIEILWQDGPLGRGDDRKEPNGAFVEGVIEAAKQRLEFFQNPAGPGTPAGKFACESNRKAIEHLDAALLCLDERNAERCAREVEGTHTA